MGQVMPVPMCIRLVCVARAPSHVHVNAAWPSSLHGWKWSLTSSVSKPAFSASMAFWSSVVGGNCSVPALYPNCNCSINYLQSLDMTHSTLACDCALYSTTFLAFVSPFYLAPLVGEGVPRACCSQ